MILLLQRCIRKAGGTLPKSPRGVSPTALVCKPTGYGLEKNLDSYPSFTRYYSAVSWKSSLISLQSLSKSSLEHDPAARPVEEFKLPPEIRITTLDNQNILEDTLSALTQHHSHSGAGAPAVPAASPVFGFDAEWNMSRRIGVSIIQLAPSALPKDIFIIPVRALPLLGYSSH